MICQVPILDISHYVDPNRPLDMHLSGMIVSNRFLQHFAIFCRLHNFSLSPVSCQVSHGRTGRPAGHGGQPLLQTSSKPGRDRGSPGRLVSKVSRLLKEAWDRGIIEVNMRTPMPARLCAGAGAHDTVWPARRRTCWRPSSEADEASLLVATGQLAAMLPAAGDSDACAWLDHRPGLGHGRAVDGGGPAQPPGPAHRRRSS